MGEVVAKFGKIDIVVTSAGVMHLNELDKLTEAEYDNMMALNVKGPLFLAQVRLFPFSFLIYTPSLSPNIIYKGKKTILKVNNRKQPPTSPQEAA